MPMAATSPIMAIPCIPIRATLHLCRPTARVLETSGSLSPPPSRPPHHQAVRLHPVGTTIGPDIPTWRTYLDTAQPYMSKRQDARETAGNRSWWETSRTPHAGTAHTLPRRAHLPFSP